MSSKTRCNFFFLFLFFSVGKSSKMAKTYPKMVQIPLFYSPGCHPVQQYFVVPRHQFKTFKCAWQVKEIEMFFLSASADHYIQYFFILNSSALKTINSSLSKPSNPPPQNQTSRTSKTASYRRFWDFQNFLLPQIVPELQNFENLPHATDFLFKLP